MDNWLITLDEIYSMRAAEKSGKSLFLHAPYDAAALASLRGLDQYQCYFAEDAAALMNAGLDVSADIDEDIKYSHVLVRAAQNRTELKGLIGQAVMACGPRALVFAAQANDQGAKALDKDLKKAFKSVDVTVKHKCRGFTLDVGEGADIKLLKSWIADAQLQISDKTGYWAQPGLFGWQKVDKGSRLLADILTGDSMVLSGLGADFGCGYGFLSHSLLQNTAHHITKLALIDHDIRALTAAEANISTLDDVDADIDFAWRDISAALDLGHKLDFIVMNPPFHEGKKGVPHLGQAFIKTAAQNLKKGGRLLMVANVHLPYEALLRDVFEAVEEITVMNGFKVIEGIK